MKVKPAYIVGAVRTPIGRAGGALASWHPAELAAAAYGAVVERSGVDPALVDDVYLGCVNQIGPQTSCIARTAWLTAGLPEHTPAVTVDRRCSSSMQAVHHAVHAVAAGAMDLVVAAGVESMSVVPIGSPRRALLPDRTDPLPGPFAAPGWVERYGSGEPSQFDAAELLVERWALSRPDLEELAVSSHRRAAAAWGAGRYDAEIVPIADLAGDEGIRDPIDPARVGSLPALREGGTITAAMSSQLSDGAAALMLASDDAVERHGLTPLARVVATTAAAEDPIVMLTAPVPATRRALERTGLTADDIEVVEINEAFASVVLVCQRELGFDPEQVNPNGGAIAMGHPLGATGARLVTSLVHEVRRRRARHGLATMCAAGGQATTTVIEAM